MMSYRSGFDWAPHLKELKDMVDKGAQAIDIARHFGVTKQAVNAAACRYQIKSENVGIGKKWSQEKVSKLINLRMFGMTAREIAREMGLTLASVVEKIKAISAQEDRSETPAEKDFNRILDYLVMGHKLVREYDGRERDVYLDFNTDEKWIGIPFLGDLHFDHYKTDVLSIIDALDRLGAEKNVFVIVNGDFGDNSDIRFNPEGYQMPSVVLPLDMRKRVLQYLISKIQNLLVVTCGDHDDWVKNRAFDMINFIKEKRNASGFKTHYLGYGGFLTLGLNGIPYRMGIFHRFKNESQQNDFHPCMKFLQIMDSSCDIVSIAHRHDKSGTSFCYYQGLPKVLVRTGSAQYLTDYAWKYGFFGAINKSPFVILGTRKKEMLATPNYEEGIRQLRALNMA
jgi:hypothetical protein